ncbi:MAG: hypothetical protein DRP84_12360 [Spirochaetes bacterium]|nr:MAG: hypothetical protein DRP84_12360 [Spirochaetota bacterium]
MEIKDSLVRWFIRNILLPKNEIIDKPGFIIFTLSSKIGRVDLREILLPETIFIKLENETINHFNGKGAQLLYSVGKKFGYRYALSSNYPIAKNRKEFEKISYFLVRFLESVYARKIEYETNFNKKLFVFKAYDWIVCRKNGLGYIFSTGAGAGMLAYAFQDFNIEAIQPKCQGRGDDYCEIICGKLNDLKTLVKDVYTETDLIKLNLKSDEYEKINKLRVPRYAKNSFKTFLDSKIFRYEHGIIRHREERLLWLESSIMYLLEKELKKLPHALDILWKVSYDWGKKLAEKAGKQNPAKFIMDFFPALGFGDILVLEKSGKYKIYVNYFPWTKWAQEIDFAMFRAMLSGIIAGFIGREVKLKLIERNTSSSKGFSLVLGE